jgi:DnaJ-class molecular chaperone
VSSPEDNPADDQRAGKCKRCHGTGEVMEAISDNGPEPVMCPDCDGTGLDGIGSP